MIDHKKLSKLAELTVKVGVNIQPGQELIVTAPLEAQLYAKEISQAAYKTGAGLVTVIYEDHLSLETRLKFSKDEYLEKSTFWFHEALANTYREGAARLALSSHVEVDFDDKMQEKQSRVNKAKSASYSSIGQIFSDSVTNWNISPFVNNSWARKVFPENDLDTAVEKLWEVIFDITGVNTENAIEHWDERNTKLEKFRSLLQDMNLRKLHFSDGKTDISIGLPSEHRWSGGRSISKKGVLFNSNIPTFEVFTAPDCFETQGTVHFSKPFSVMGVMVNNAVVKFEKGKVTEFYANSGTVALQNLIDTDEGSGMLGEVALVPNSSPISQYNKIFYNTLLDENAASHIAFGRSFSKCLLNGASKKKNHANESSVHVDCMIGNENMNVDGFTSGGEMIQLMRQGEFVVFT